jgi:hypothetical protein
MNVWISWGTAIADLAFRLELAVYPGILHMLQVQPYQYVRHKTQTSFSIFLPIAVNVYAAKD